MANFRYNPTNGQIERGSDSERDNPVTTQFFVMHEGRLVFAGTQAELEALDDPYVAKIRQVNPMPQQNRIRWAELRVGVMAIVALVILGVLVFLLTGSHGFFRGKSRSIPTWTIRRIWPTALRCG